MHGSKDGLNECLIFDIKKYAIHDGPGIRTTLFFKGCPLSCIWCHNPEGISPNPEWVYDLNRCTFCGTCIDICPCNALEMVDIESGPAHQGRNEDQSRDIGSKGGVRGIEPRRGGRDIVSIRPDCEIGLRRVIRHVDRCIACGDCIALCPSGARELAGTWQSIDQLMNLIEKDLPFYESSGGGVTFSGGEPLLQWQALLALLNRCRDLEIHTAVDTTGFAPQKVIEAVADVTDLFLYDLKVMDDERHRQLTGVSNETILTNLGILSKRGVDILIRIPLIPGINDDKETIRRLANFLNTLSRPLPVELLPYHDFQQSKYRKFGMPYRGEHLKPPGRDGIDTVVSMLKAYGLDIVESKNVAS